MSAAHLRPPTSVRDTLAPSYGANAPLERSSLPIRFTRGLIRLTSRQASTPPVPASGAGWGALWLSTIAVGLDWCGVSVRLVLIPRPRYDPRTTWVHTPLVTSAAHLRHPSKVHNPLAPSYGAHAPLERDPFPIQV